MLGGRHDSIIKILPHCERTDSADLKLGCLVQGKLLLCLIDSPGGTKMFAGACNNDC